MSNDAQVEEMLLDGIRAARAGDKETARELLQQVIEADQYNEKAWFWLASVVETDEERRTCLSNVVLINPNNQRAQDLLERLEGGGNSGSGDSSRRSSMVIIAVGGALLLGVIALVALTLIGGDDSDSVAEDVPTATLTPTIDLTALNAPPTETPLPTATFTPFLPTLPPTLTLIPSPTNVPPGGIFIDSIEPGKLNGQVLIGSGRNFASNRHIPMYIMSLNAPNEQSFIQIGGSNILGASASLNSSEDQIVFERYNTGQQSVSLQLGLLTATEFQTLAILWNRDPVIPTQILPAWSPTSKLIAFVGQAQFSGQTDLAILNPDLGPEEALTIFSSENVNEAWPEWSPDGAQIVYVAETTEFGLQQVDLRVFNLADSSVSSLTDDGSAVIESMPDWGGPDGNFVIYSADAGNGSDIWIAPINNIEPLNTVLPTATPASISAPEDGEEPAPPEEPAGDDSEATDNTDSEGTDDTEADNSESDEPTEEPTATATLEPTATPTEPPSDIALADITAPQRLFDFGPNDIMPIWSPDGRFILFSSDLIDSNFDIFVYEIATGEVTLLYGDDSTRDIVFDWFDG